MSTHSEILTGKLRVGDNNAFREIYTLHWKKVYNLCFYYSRSHEDAEEMTQQIFLSLWSRRETLEIHGSIEHYLARSARYQVLNYFRGRAARIKAEVAWQPVAIENTTQETVDFNELQHSIQKYTTKLPPKSKQVFELKQSGIRTNKEIAEVMDISEKTVEYHISYIRRTLRASLSGHLQFLILFFLI